MNRFTLNQLSFLSGLPQQTILFWNKKYNALGYKDENFKDKYSTDDLHRILNISTLFHLNKKYDLQTICLWENTRLATTVEIELLTNFIHHEDVINQLVASCLTYNEKRFNLIIDITLKKIPMIKFYEEILYPFLLRIYSTFSDKHEKPVQFFYMKNLLKRKFYTLIDKKSGYINKTNTVLLFLPENEFNEIGLLFCNLILIELGYKTYYIGPNQKIKAIEQAIRDLNPNLLISYIPSKENYFSYKETLNHFDSYEKNLILFGAKPNLESFKYSNFLKISDLQTLHETLEIYETKKVELI